MAIVTMLIIEPSTANNTIGKIVHQESDNIQISPMQSTIKPPRFIKTECYSSFLDNAFIF